MPFYEYQCRACGDKLELMQKISDAPVRKCPSCGKSQLQRLISAPVFRLAGSGWYETDFKGDKDKKRNLVGADADESKKPDKKGETPPEAKAETKTETKPEAKADAKAEAAPDKAAPKSASRSASKKSARPAIARKKTRR